MATICARGGSTGLPRKNIKPLLGKPLIAWTIQHALSVSCISAVYISTDDPEIAEVASSFGAKFLGPRPSELASASAPKLPVIRHLVGSIEAAGEYPDVVVDLDPTSPLRDVKDIQASIDLLRPDVDVVITAYPSEKNPYFNMIEQSVEGSWSLAKTSPKAVFSRQSAPPVFSMNASVYVWHRRTLDKDLWDGRVAVHVMPRERSIDIDSLLDFRIVELLMSEKSK